MRRVLGLGVVLAGGLLAAPTASAQLPPGFVKTHLYQGFDSPTSLDFLPDGRMLVTELGGKVHLADSHGVYGTPALQLPADRSTLDRGLFRVRTDPNFAVNGWVYFFWTTQEPRNRVSRFTMAGDQADPASELVVWESPDLASSFHHGGSLAFSNDGDLYIGVGDQYASANAQVLVNPYGKILRLHPDGSVPVDNPFVNTPGADPAIWVLGIRNPFRLSVNPDDDELWIGEVGGNTDVAWEEINLAIAGANYGWPFQEGEACYSSDCTGYEFPVFSFNHPDPEYWYGTEQGSMTLGPFYSAEVFPEDYHGALFFGDYSNQWIRVMSFDHGLRGRPEIEVFEESPDGGTIVDLALGPDGALYSVTIGWEIYGQSAPEGVWRYEYTGTSNLPPVAVADAVPRDGDAPLNVQFVGSNSFDPDAGPGILQYDWVFGDGGSSTTADPTHVYTQRGSYHATLTVDDGEIAVSAPALEITVGGAPNPRILAPAWGTTYRAGDTVQFLGRARDPEDGLLPDSAFTWEVRLIHAEHGHSFYGPISGVSAGQFTIPDSGHTPEGTEFLIQLTVVDSDGITRTQQRPIKPVRAPFLLRSDPSGIPINVDGEFLWTPRRYQSVSGFLHVFEAQQEYELGGKRYRFAGWEDGSKSRIRSYRASEPAASGGPIPVLKALYDRARH